MLIALVMVMIFVLIVLLRNRNSNTQDLFHADQKLVQIDTRLTDFSQAIFQQVETLNNVLHTQITELRNDNNTSLDKMRETVDEKLTQTIHDRLTLSFQQVNRQLESVEHGLHAMSKLASDVGDLRKILSNTKRRGMVGEIQLGAILQEILSPEQYVKNAHIKEGKREVVEFAVKIPIDHGEAFLLPIDAKFPGESYKHLVEAIEINDSEQIVLARNNLLSTIRSEAKDIAAKYIEVPKTTNFAILFLPFEGLYAEVANQPGFIEELQRDYSVNIAGPSTMAALLNSLQLSYQTFALQKQTDDIFRVLQSVKAELPKWQKQLTEVQINLSKAVKSLDILRTTRTNKLERKLQTISLPLDSLDNTDTN